jgi:hypothetical protein
MALVEYLFRVLPGDVAPSGFDQAVELMARMPQATSQKGSSGNISSQLCSNVGKST